MRPGCQLLCSALLPSWQTGPFSFFLLLLFFFLYLCSTLLSFHTLRDFTKLQCHGPEGENSWEQNVNSPRATGLVAPARRLDLLPACPFFFSPQWNWICWNKRDLFLCQVSNVSTLSQLLHMTGLSKSCCPCLQTKLRSAGISVKLYLQKWKTEWNSRMWLKKKSPSKGWISWYFFEPVVAENWRSCWKSCFKKWWDMSLHTVFLRDSSTSRFSVLATFLWCKYFRLKYLSKKIIQSHYYPEDEFYLH